MQMIIRKIIRQGLLTLLGLALFGCSSADNEMAGGNLQAVNHTVHAINWMSVNGYRADGGGGSSCCIIMPAKWRPGLKAHIEWEVDPEPYAYSKWPRLGTDGYRVAQAKHKANYQHHSTTVEIPEWPGTKRCGLKVHFLVCNQVKVTSSCWAFNSEHYPIKEPSQMKEPAVCRK
ncbi:DUF3304 domain-containing protein [Pseudomonas agarici]|uniref:DUF3304 domain-containing protein n=2 Tax=Pseudomonas agarici TaxID=46677 RepID=UPI0008C30B1C|nr:DUF3304 domain-containing protein [Pseudomonas agarici]NWC07432.1 DUF3304 domain-containing protein [Pseudomonas agarici]SEK44333.1 Protein of unknown function [Pseudomonas agarici]